MRHACNCEHQHHSSCHICTRLPDTLRLLHSHSFAISRQVRRQGGCQRPVAERQRRKGASGKARVFMGPSACTANFSHSDPGSGAFDSRQISCVGVTFSNYKGNSGNLSTTCLLFGPASDIIGGGPDSAKRRETTLGTLFGASQKGLSEMGSLDLQFAALSTSLRLLKAS